MIRSDSTRPKAHTRSVKKTPKPYTRTYRHMTKAELTEIHISPWSTFFGGLRKLFSSSQHKTFRSASVAPFLTLQFEWPPFQIPPAHEISFVVCHNPFQPKIPPLNCVKTLEILLHDRTRENKKIRNDVVWMWGVQKFANAWMFYSSPDSGRKKRSFCMLFSVCGAVFFCPAEIKSEIRNDSQLQSDLV